MRKCNYFTVMFITQCPYSLAKNQGLPTLYKLDDNITCSIMNTFFSASKIYQF